MAIPNAGKDEEPQDYSRITGGNKNGVMVLEGKFSVSYKTTQSTAMLSSD